jgi:hypothetical protein
MENPNWPAVIFRVFAVTNFLVAIVGAFFLASVVPSVVVGSIGNSAEEPYFIQFYWSMTAINVCFLGLLVLGGVYLVRLEKFGVVICNVVFVAEILYFFLGIGLLWSPAFSRPISGSAAAATGVGNMGLSPQLISAYPVIALVCLNLARWRLTAAEAAAFKRPETSSVS